jgi:hypothetical protein
MVRRMETEVPEMEVHHLQSLMEMVQEMETHRQRHRMETDLREMEAHRQHHRMETDLREMEVHHQHRRMEVHHLQSLQITLAAAVIERMILEEH